jgi:hypothetical protein
MQNIKSIAIIGHQTKEIFLYFGLATRYQLLLFDNNEKALAEIHQALYKKIGMPPLSRCPAQSMLVGRRISLFWGFVLMIPKSFKIKNVATAKPLS